MKQWKTVRKAQRKAGIGSRDKKDQRGWKRGEKAEKEKN